jgi:hypothetical protein
MVIVESVALLILGALGLVGGVSSYLSMDARMQSSMMKPGMYVCGLSIAMIVVALAYAYCGLKQAHSVLEEEKQTSESWKESSVLVFLALGAVGLYAYLISIIGYLPSTLLFLIVQFRLFGVDSLWRNITISIAVAAMFYFVFIHYGGMVFPHASLFD